MLGYPRMTPENYSSAHLLKAIDLSVKIFET
jgi:hypothetical protein